MTIRTLLLTTAAVVALAASAGSAQALVASTDHTYDFAGQCSDCAGSVTAELTLRDYTPGTDLTYANFVSLSYGGSNLFPAYEITSLGALGDLSGSLGTAPGFYDVSVDNIDFSTTSYFFNTSGAGIWDTGQVTFADMGVDGTWNAATPISAAPEPSSWALMLLGIGGAGLALRRSARKAGVQAAA